MIREPEIAAVIAGERPGFRLIIDSRTHDLHLGEYGAIPGWHTDFVPRPEKRKGQPDYTQIDSETLFYMVNMSDHPDGVSNTEVVNVPVDFTIPTTRVYQAMDQFINHHPEISRYKIRDGQILSFDQETIHQGTQAHHAGTRFFLRIAILSDRAADEIRTQVQSYMSIQDEVQRRIRKHFSRLGRIDLDPTPG